MNELTRTAPREIYLQVSDDEGHYNEPWPTEAEYTGDVTWSSESAQACEVGYVREDIVASQKAAAIVEDPGDEQLADACMWHQHDFGLCDDEEKRRRMFVMRETWRAIWKAINTPGRGGELMPKNHE